MTQVDPVLMSSISWIEFQRRVSQENLVVFIPCGSLEQHGPHLPLGTDALLCTAVAQGVAREVNGLVAPTLNYGYKSQPRCGGGQHFPGTTSLDGNSLSQMTRDIIRELARHQVRHIAFIDGHYENQWFLTEGIELAMRDLGKTAAVQVMRLEYWDFCSEQTLKEVFPEGFPGFALEHAAVIETSLMLHYYPELVHLDLIPSDGPAEFPPYDLYPADTSLVPASGVLSSAKGASLQKGALLATQISKSIAAAVHQEFCS
jgi:creatinine amidohydrolase